VTTPSPGTGWGGIFFHLFPYIEQNNLYQSAATTGANPVGESPGAGQPYYSGAYALGTSSFIGTRQLPDFICPSDPTVPNGVPYTDVLWGRQWGTSCYAGNFLVFGQTDAFFNVLGYASNGRIPATITDGTSNTILFAERYAVCVSYALALERACLWDFFEPPNFLWGGPGHDYFPTIAEQTSNGDNIGPIANFQVRPQQGYCDASRASTAHIGGIQVVLADGSVRTLSAGMSGTTWWAACTPSSGDLLGSDW
jgi:hypothetical protein